MNPFARWLISLAIFVALIALGHLTHDPNPGGTIVVLFVGSATTVLVGLLVLVAKTRGWL